MFVSCADVGHRKLTFLQRKIRHDRVKVMRHRYHLCQDSRLYRSSPFSFATTPSNKLGHC